MRYKVEVDDLFNFMRNTMTEDSNKGITLVAGGAGFVGSQLIKHLLERGEKIFVVDNFSRGKRIYLESFMSNPLFTLIECDVAVRNKCVDIFEAAKSCGGVNEVWHFAANSDIPAGIENPDIDLKDTFLSTFELVRASKIFNVRNFHFASSSAIYGDLGLGLLHEDVGPLLPISNYGAMKLASEAQLSAAAESFLERVNIFRFPNVVGHPATHGVILDFINKLIQSPKLLNVLGDGTQQKPYLHVSDLIGAMLTIRDSHLSKNIQVVNIGPLDEGVTVKWIAERVVERVSPDAVIVYGNENRGWVGDVPKFSYSTARLQSLGWKPKLSSADAIKFAIEEIARDLGV